MDIDSLEIQQLRKQSAEYAADLKPYQAKYGTLEKALAEMDSDAVILRVALGG